MSTSVSLAPTTHVVILCASSTCWVHCWLASQLRNLNLYNGLQANLPQPGQPGPLPTLSLLYQRQTRPLLCRTILFLSSKAIYYTNILEKTVFLLTRCADMSETNRDLSPDCLKQAEAADSVNHAFYCSLPAARGSPRWQPVNICGHVSCPAPLLRSCRSESIFLALEPHISVNGTIHLISGRIKGERGP